MIKIFYNSKVACKYCSLAVSFMERYKFEYKTIDISVSENEKEYDMAENVLMEQMESSSVLPYIIIDDTYGFLSINTLWLVRKKFVNPLVNP